LRVRVTALLFVLFFTIGLALVWSTRNAIDLLTVPAGPADARADRALSDADVARHARTIERSVAYVEDLFKRPFALPPKVLLFAFASFQPC